MRFPSSRVALRAALLMAALSLGPVAFAAGQTDTQPVFVGAKAVQLNLIWTGDYPGPLDGDLGPATQRAIKKFQQAHGDAPTGVLTSGELAALSSDAARERQKIGFRYVIDPATGAQIGIPFGYVTQQKKTPRGTSFSSGDGNLEIQTFALSTTERDLSSLYTKLKSQIPNRVVWYSPFHGDWFVLAGRDNDADGTQHDFYVRAHSDGQHIRGFSMSYMEGRYPDIPVIIGAMSFTFRPFASNIVAVAPSQVSPLPEAPTSPSQPTPISTSPSAIIALQNSGGTYEVPVVINGAITLPFIIDSGASSVMIPADVVLTLMRAKTIEESDFIGEQKYQLADGSVAPSMTFRIRSLKVGDKTLTDVIGSIAPIKGSLLLGQSFLSRFKSWSIDNSTLQLSLQ